MIDIKKKFEDNYLLGCIKYKGAFRNYLMPVAWWILNYKKYDPGYDPAKWQFVFRDHIYNVSDSEVDRFMRAIEADSLDTNKLRVVIKELPPEHAHLYFFIDFDRKLFVNGFADVEVEEYLPEGSWKGEFGDPVNYLPEEMKAIFKR